MIKFPTFPRDQNNKYLENEDLLGNYRVQRGKLLIC